MTDRSNEPSATGHETARLSNSSTAEVMVARLLAYRPVCNEWGDRSEHVICNEAADLLTRLSADNARLEGELQQLRCQPIEDMYALAIKERERAEAERDALKLALTMIATSQGEGDVWKWRRDLAKATLTGKTDEPSASLEGRRDTTNTSGDRT